MIKTRTTFVVGAGASSELALPDNDELLLKIGQSFDFTRLGTPTQTRDGALLSQVMGRMAALADMNESDVERAAARLHTAAKFGRSIDALLDQHDTDPLVEACAKVAIVHFLSQAEAKSILRLTARVPGDLPIQGSETWLYQFGQLVTAGVPRSKAGNCLDNLSIVSFNYDRSIEHFLPHALVMALGMPLAEAQALVAERLRVIHPGGTIGRLPWQAGEQPELEWGTEQPGNIHDLAGGLRTPAEIVRDEARVGEIRGMVSNAQRLVFLGFGFHPRNLDLLFGDTPGQAPEVLATAWNMSAAAMGAIGRTLRARCGTADDEKFVIAAQRANDLLHDYALLLEG